MSCYVAHSRRGPGPADRAAGAGSRDAAGAVESGAVDHGVVGSGGAGRAEPAITVQVAALQALCRQVFGFRLVMLAVASPIALVKVAHGAGPGTSAWVVGSAVVITFMGSYLLFRDWERFGPLLLRHPALLAVDTFFAAVLLAVATPESPLAYVTICTPLLAGLVYGLRGSALFTGIQILVVTGVVSVDAHGHAVAVANYLLLPGFCLIAGVVGLSLRRLMLRFGAATRALTETRSRLAVTEAVGAERARLAREMHDSLAKTLRGATMTAEALAASAGTLDADAVRDRAELVARSVRRAAAESRELLRELRRGSDDYGDPAGRAEVSPADELAARTREFEGRTGMTARFRAPAGTAAVPSVPRAVARQLASVVDEALENVHRHSGATRADVTVGVADGVLWISVLDDGRGMPPDATPESLRAGGYFGVVGMFERAAGIGAHLRVGPGPADGAAGTEVRLELPLAAVLPAATPAPAPEGGAG